MRGVLLDPETGHAVSEREFLYKKRMREEAIGVASPRITPISVDPDSLRKLHVPEDRQELLKRILDDLDKAKKFPEIKNYTRNKHYIGNRTAATAATARNVAATLWNPHASSRIFLYEIWCINTTATSYNVSVARTTTRGTATTTSTAAIANSIENDTAAPSGFVLDVAYSAQPTVNAADLIRWIVPGAIGNGFMVQFPDPVTIPPAGGLALIAATATIFQISDVTFVVGD